MSTYDLLLTNVRVVRHDRPEPELMDIGVTDGRISRVAPQIDRAEAAQVVDGGGRLAFPGVVDAHQHWGIYNPLSEDAVSESRASVQGGVTTALNYMRTGQYYLNRGGRYADFFPEVLAATEGRSYIDYGFHLAPMSREHIGEVPSLVEEHGVTSFKIFMFYGSHGLHGRSTDQNSFLMIPEGERYDYAHFEFVMRGVQAARERFPELADEISLSLHCETAEIMSAYTKQVEQDGTLRGLEAYHASRPPHSEGLAVSIASYLAHETGLPKINLLHLTSEKAVDAALRMARAFPHIDFRREVTIGHLVADIDTAHGLGGKVNPPLRPRADVEALWGYVLDGKIDWVVSDHACCKDEVKFGEPRDDIFVAKSGFGGAEYLLPGLVTEGNRRGLSYQRVAELTSWNPAQRFGLRNKGALLQGYDADICLVDPDSTWTVRAEDSESTQEYTPFEGFELTARVTDTFVRGQHVLVDGKVTGEPAGRYLARPQR
ncbi:MULTISPECIES: dihydroorotase family protein [unclassified Micromonospora]|uniref:dihydroorotase n=1 Tax=unclassified Micromonospora TaxID=2617518 RepID=UPI00188E7F67|nr:MULTISPECIES: dihydroorotase family protein [unclassified Micromonospora]MBF5028798.1 dihydroorotase family protein [Micromonospora sp. ANENR4]MCZ7476073.1 dihydroorotase family protein [Micromonospora sp. WMMC273]WBC00935.1 dihydroorotase family protein [Micromonospora sp. WMMA1976]